MRAPSVFTPEALLREARRQKGIGAGTVPAAEAITAAKDAGILAVEMEAAALYAFAAARSRPVLCFAHVTNQMGRAEGDFEKGVADGAEESLNVISQVARGWRSR
jgi:purine-nucleoside phosphorylase